MVSKLTSAITTPVWMTLAHMRVSISRSSTCRGFRAIRSSVGGSTPIASAGPESVMRLIHSNCVASNGNHAKVNFTLGHTGLLPRFMGHTTARIFTADDVAHPKPAPDLFLLAARTLGALPAHTTVVEDTPTGITAAKAAGMRAIGYAAMTPAPRLQAAGADAIATSMADVAALLAAESHW